jgi:hypothetical protein
MLVRPLDNVDDDGRAAAWQQITEALGRCASPDGLIGPCEMLVVTATRSTN